MRQNIPRRLLAALLPALALTLPGSTGRADDTALFSTNVAPNVVLLVDNSGSMNHIVWHEEFDPDVAPTCQFYVDTNTATYIYNSDITFTRCSKTITLYHDPSIAPDFNRITGRYLNWLFSPESDAYTADIASSTNGTRSSCLGGGSFAKYKRARVTAAKDILREVICEVNAAGSVRFGLAQFRRAGADNDPNGGFVRVPVHDYGDTYTLNGQNKSHGNHLNDAIDALDGETWTPLGETLFQVYTYFMSRVGTDLPESVVNPGLVFPAYEYDTNASGNYGDPSVGSVPDSPVQYRCQKNFVVVITDGEPTMDDFDIDSNTADGTNVGFAQFPQLIGDYNSDNALPEQDDEENGDLIALGNESAFYLDDIARYMQLNDSRPDLEGSQTIDVYTVGFTTGNEANQLLEKTAAVGNGLFFQSNNAEDLAQAIVESLTDIIEKSQAFTAATVPASRTTDGNNIYTSFFIPSETSSFWEGHLKNFEFTASGEIHDEDGACAVDDPTPGSCQSGPLLANAEAFWDAAEEVPLPASRNLYVALPGTVRQSPLAVPPDLDAAAVDATDLGVVSGDIPSYPGSNAVDEEDLADEIVDWLRGCEFGSTASPCTPRSMRLGDIFHSNPIVVGPPNAAVNELSYLDFASTYGTRRRVIYAGANDGLLHGFNAGDWDSLAVPPAYDRGTGIEVMGFMPWEVRQAAKDLPIDTPPRDTYAVDGSPQTADAWFHPTPTTTTKLGSQWHTVLIGGLRQGGRSYYALDVTNPSGLLSGPAYPGYLWQFPCEGTSCDGDRAYMGETWSEPIITRVRVGIDGDTNGGAGYERWVAIFAGGYDPSGDPNDQAAYDSSATAGRAIWMVEVATGQVLAVKKFDALAPSGDPQADMLYAIASTPAVFDLNFDGFADVIYAGDLGGNVWKWVIQPVGGDPNNCSVCTTADDVSQPNWTFRHFLQAPSYTDVDTSLTWYKSFFAPPAGTLYGGKLALAFGSGERNLLSFEGLDDGLGKTGENNRFYVVFDAKPTETAATAPATLGDANFEDRTLVTGCSPLSTSKLGYYLVGEDGEKFITSSEVSFGDVVTTSFVPVVSSDPCTAGGVAYLYQFDLSCGEGVFAGVTAIDQRRKQIGEGLPTPPRISVGPLDGAFPCPHRVLVITSEGNVGNDCAGSPPNNGTRLRHWRERGQAF